MCEGFCVIVTRDLNMYFTAPDMSGDISHDDILDVMLKNKLISRSQFHSFSPDYGRLQCTDWRIYTSYIDIWGRDAPSWVYEHENEIMHKFNNLMIQVRAFYRKYLRQVAYHEKKYELWSAEHPVWDGGSYYREHVTEPGVKSYKRFVKSLEIFPEFIQVLSPQL